jgi:hypothetical protein
MPRAGLSTRGCGIASLALLAAYAASIALLARASGRPFGELELFPLGGGGDDGGWLAGALGLGLVLALGWGVPGLSLALLAPKPPDAFGLLPRAFGLGFGYIVLIGIAYGALFGHAPPLAILLILLALPPAALALRARAGAPSLVGAPTVIIAAFVAMTALAAVLWPHLGGAALSGDGAEVYELARSLEHHALPRWDLEEAEPHGRFGTPMVVPFFTGAYFTSAGMTILGRGELAARLPFVVALVVVLVTTIGLVPRRSRGAWTYAGAVTCVFALWSTFHMTHEPAFPDLAAPAASDALTIALWLAGFREMVNGSPWLAAGFLALAAGVTFAAPVLAIIAIVLLCVHRPVLGAGAARAAAIVAVNALVFVAWLGWQGGDLHEWVRQIREEHVLDYTRGSGRRESAIHAGRLLLMTGGLPLAALFAWGRLGVASRVLFLTGTVYLVVLFVSGQRSLHHLAPLPWLFMPAAIEAATGRWRVLAYGAAAALVVTFALSWPGDRTVNTATIALGRESRITGLDYEAAALAAGGVYEVLAPPPGTARLAVSKHAFVRYALDLGGTEGVLGLSPEPPVGAIPLANATASIWTTDVDRYAKWRFHQPSVPASWLFPAGTRPGYPRSAAAWMGRLDLREEPARALPISGFARDASGYPSLGVRVRLLLPVPDAHMRGVVAMSALTQTRATISANGGAIHPLSIASGDHVVDLPVPLRAGWNVVEIAGAEGVTLRSLEIR